MKRKLSMYGLSAATLAVAAFLALAPSLRAQSPKCYPSYMTLSGTCPDSCGRGPDCPCTTCETVLPAT